MTGRPPVTEENREIARTVAAVFGGEPVVHSWWDEARLRNVDILSCVDSPTPGVTAYATLNLSNNRLAEVENDLRVELLGACHSATALFPNLLSTCPFNAIQPGAVIRPGVVFPEVTALYDPALAMRHILFTPPFYWDDKPQTLTMPGRTVAWLLALPISDAEFDHVKTKGFRSLLDVMEASRPDVYDLDRPSVV